MIVMKSIIAGVLLFFLLAPPSVSLDWKPDSGNYDPKAAAAAYCRDQGYIYQADTGHWDSSSGSWVPGKGDLCIFPDGSSCPAYDFMGGECSYNGISNHEGQEESPQMPSRADFIAVRGKLISDSVGSIQGSDNYFDITVDTVLENTYPNIISSGDIIRVHSKSYALISDFVKGRCVEVRGQYSGTNLWVIDNDAKEISCQPEPVTPQPGGSVNGCDQQACLAQNQPIGEPYTKDGKTYQRYKDCKCVGDECECKTVDKEIPTPCDQQACLAQNQPIGEPYTKDGKTYQRYKDCKCIDDECKCERLEKEIPTPCDQKACQAQTQSVGAPYMKDSKVYQKYNECNCVDNKCQCQTVEKEVPLLSYKWYDISSEKDTFILFVETVAPIDDPYMKPLSSLDKIDRIYIKDSNGNLVLCNINCAN